MLEAFLSNANILNTLIEEAEAGLFIRRRSLLEEARNTCRLRLSPFPLSTADRELPPDVTPSFKMGAEEEVLLVDAYCGGGGC